MSDTESSSKQTTPSETETKSKQGLPRAKPDTNAKYTFGLKPNERAKSHEWDIPEKQKIELQVRFRQEFRAVVETGRSLELPAHYNAEERKVGHRVAQEMGLTSASIAEGFERRLVVHAGQVNTWGHAV